jgi:hypothetical protein
MWGGSVIDDGVWGLGGFEKSQRVPAEKDDERAII